MHTMPAWRAIRRAWAYRQGVHERHIGEARKLFCNIDYRSPTAAKYRKEISDFYDFVKAHPAPAGQPEATVALAKGNYDLCYHEYASRPGRRRRLKQAERNHDWYEGDPERSWDVIKTTFYPRPPVLAPHKNFHLSGTPYGMVDIVSFANDHIDAESWRGTTGRCSSRAGTRAPINSTASSWTT